jgi:hypothetical protein
MWEIPGLYIVLFVSVLLVGGIAYLVLRKSGKA